MKITIVIEDSALLTGRRSETYNYPLSFALVFMCTVLERVFQPRFFRYIADNAPDSSDICETFEC